MQRWHPLDLVEKDLDLSARFGAGPRCFFAAPPRGALKLDADVGTELLPLDDHAIRDPGVLDLPLQFLDATARYRRFDHGVSSAPN